MKKITNEKWEFFWKDALKNVELGRLLHQWSHIFLEQIAQILPFLLLATVMHQNIKLYQNIRYQINR